MTIGKILLIAGAALAAGWSGLVPPASADDRGADRGERGFAPTEPPASSDDYGSSSIIDIGGYGAIRRADGTMGCQDLTTGAWVRQGLCPEFTA